MDALRHADQEAVGFVPFSRWEREVERDYNTLLVMRENNDLVGYIFWTRGWPVAAIQQVVVRSDARRDERATALVDAAMKEMVTQYRYGATCRCRVNLEATAFWEALGFRVVRLEESGRRGPLIRYYKELAPALFDLGDYLRRPSFGAGAGQRKGFRRLKVGAR